MAGLIGTGWPLRDGWIWMRQLLRTRIPIYLDSYWQRLLLSNMNTIYSSLASCILQLYSSSLRHNPVRFFSSSLRKMYPIWAFSSILTSLTDAKPAVRDTYRQTKRTKKNRHCSSNKQTACSNFSSSPCLLHTWNQVHIEKDNQMDWNKKWEIIKGPCLLMQNRQCPEYMYSPEVEKEKKKKKFFSCYTSNTNTSDIRTNCKSTDKSQQSEWPICLSSGADEKKKKTEPYERNSEVKVRRQTGMNEKTCRGMKSINW